MADDGPLEAAGVEPGGFLLATTHRAGNVDDPERLRALVRVLREASDLPVVLPLHPRTRARLEAANLLGELTAGDRVRVLPPLGYVPFTSLLTRAAGVLTDSGGVQKEAYLAGIRCVTMRDTTEWVETVQSGWNTLVDLDAGRRPRGAGRAASAGAARAVRRRPRRRPRGRGRRHARRADQPAGRPSRTSVTPEPANAAPDRARRARRRPPGRPARRPGRASGTARGRPARSRRRTSRRPTG